MNQIIYPIHALHYLKTARPGQVMKKYVDYYFEVKVPTSPKDVLYHTTLPTFNTFLCFNLNGSRWSFIQENREKNVHVSALVGYTLKIRQNKLPNGMHAFFVALKPGIAPILLKDACGSIINKVVDMDLFTTHSFIEEKLHDQDTFYSRISLFENLFLPEFQKLSVGYRYDIVQRGLSLFQENPENNKDVKTVCQKLAVSYPTLHRYFHSTVGYPPHFCQKLIKFKEGLKSYKMEGYKFPHWRYGFTDYSHFVKVTKQFTDLKPSQL